MMENCETPNTMDATPHDRILQVLVDSLPSMVGYWDASQRNNFANRAYADWFGIDPGRMSGMHIRDLLGEELYQANLPYIEGVLRGEAQEFERAVPAPDDGGVRHSLAQYIPHVVEGEVRGFFVLVSDIGHVKRVDEALREGEARFRDLFERAPLPYQSINGEGRILVVNLAWTQMFGYARDEVLGHSIGEFLTEDSRRKLAIEFPQIKATGTTAGVTMDIVCKDGRQRTVEVTGNTTCDLAGRFVCTHCLLTDVTERIAAQKALQDREERLRLLFTHAPVGIIVLSNDFKLIDVNAVFCQLLGYSADELKNMNSFLDFTHPDDRVADREFISNVLPGSISHHVKEKRYVHKDGHVIWVRVTRAPIRDAAGNFKHGLGLVEDISAQREAERLRIDSLERQRDILVREVHHRIKNNLQGVIGLIEQLQRKQPAAAGVLEEAAGQISAIAVVHGLYSTTLSSEVRPRQLVRAIVESLGRLSGTTIRYREDVDHPEWEWRLDSRNIVSVALIINELLYNAIKHTAPGGDIEVHYGSHGTAIDVRVRNRPAALAPGFDFAAGSGLGTGLTLITSLLPRRGASLVLRQQGDTVEAHLELTHPCASAAVIGDASREDMA